MPRDGSKSPVMFSSPKAGSISPFGMMRKLAIGGDAQEEWSDDSVDSGDSDDGGDAKRSMDEKLLTSLPAQWSRHLDPQSGNYFYFNSKTRESQWEVPQLVEKSMRKRNLPPSLKIGPGYEDVERKAAQPTRGSRVSIFKHSDVDFADTMDFEEGDEEGNRDDHECDAKKREEDDKGKGDCDEAKHPLFGVAMMPAAARQEAAASGGEESETKKLQEETKRDGVSGETEEKDEAGGSGKEKEEPGGGGDGSSGGDDARANGDVNEDGSGTAADVGAAAASSERKVEKRRRSSGVQRTTVLNELGEVVPLPKVPARKLTKDYLALAKEYGKFKEYRMLNDDLKCVLCNTNTADQVMFPCGHKCACSMCCDEKEIYDPYEDTNDEWCVSRCPCCGADIKKVMTHEEGGTEYGKFWSNFMQPRAPPMPKAFAKNFRRNSSYTSNGDHSARSATGSVGTPNSGRSYDGGSGRLGRRSIRSDMSPSRSPSPMRSPSRSPMGGRLSFRRASADDLSPMNGGSSRIDDARSRSARSQRAALLNSPGSSTGGDSYRSLGSLNGSKDAREAHAGGSDMLAVIQSGAVAEYGVADRAVAISPAGSTGPTGSVRTSTRSIMVAEKISESPEIDARSQASQSPSTPLAALPTTAESPPNGASAAGASGDGAGVQEAPKSKGCVVC